MRFNFDLPLFIQKYNALQNLYNALFIKASSKVLLYTLKGGVSDFWKTMLMFEITKTNTPQAQKGLAPIFIAPPHTYKAYATHAKISSVKQSKTNVTQCLHWTRAVRQNI